jgi:diaminopimelate decarboxylase
MVKGTFPIEKFGQLQTPFYYYDMALLQDTLNVIRTEIRRYDFEQHYAIKANANPRILALIARNGLGADCVSGGEIRAAQEAGFPASGIVFAGVGKADWEINLGLDQEIACFNVESIAELEVIDALAKAKKKTAPVALRINPNVDAHTHAKITTGLQENKFGIHLGMLDKVRETLLSLKHVRFTGLHFHIGSQITDMTAFRDLCIRSNELQRWFEERGMQIENMNFGGGLGIDYHHPNHRCIPDLEDYFAVFHQFVERRPGQRLHFELGRSVAGQCGTMISRTLYVKQGEEKQFAVMDAGFTDLIRPAMYDAYHRIENISNDGPPDCIYDVVGPVCESSDVFGRDVPLEEVRRNDLLAFRSAGAYGEIMASQYNCRPLPKSYFSDTI